jgi:CheY-like chemotaxis protein
MHANSTDESSALKNILVIEDDVEARLLMVRLLSDAGFSVVSAGTGRDALKCARENPPDLITLDYLMPRMNGWEIMRAIKSDTRLRDIPVLIVSVVAEENREALEDAVDFVSKPFDNNSLISMVKKYL